MISRLILFMALAMVPVALAAQDTLTPPVPEVLVSGDQIGPAQPVSAQPNEPVPGHSTGVETAQDASVQAAEFLRKGGPSIWAIAALSVVTVALILWKIWRLALIGDAAHGVRETWINGEKLLRHPGL